MAEQTLLAKVMVEVPHVPNFLRLAPELQESEAQVSAEERTLPISVFDDEQLKHLGERWTEALIEQAKAQKHHDGRGPG